MRLVLYRSFRSLGLALALTLPASAFAQARPQYAPPPPSPPPQGVAVPQFPGPDMTRLLMALSEVPATHSGFTFDRSMLQFAQSILQQNGIDPGRAAAAISGVAFDRFQYQQPAFYTPEAMSALIQNYRAAGWKHFVNGNQTPANTAQPQAMATDLWLHFAGPNIDALTVLTRTSSDMNVVHITGALRPLDLLHLAGHFGIPKIDPDAVMVPDR